MEASTRPITELRWAIVPLVVTVALTLAPGVAGAAQGQVERGAELLSAIERGETSCGDLDSADFEAIGELVMGRMLGSAGAHEAMDRTMASMMGRGGLERMHAVMGVRFSGCGNPQFPDSFGAMMGAIGMMGGGFGRGGEMMGGGFGPRADDAGPPGQRYGPAAMMGFSRSAEDDDDDVGLWMLIAMLILVVGAVVAVVVLARPGRRPGGPEALELLAARFADGELSADEYAERRRLLEEGAR